MKRALILLASLSLVVSAGFAQKPKVVVPKKISCAVMKGDMVDIAKATKNKLFADYKGRRYFFCCPGCPGAFKANPAKYAKSPSIAIPKKG
jgi:YHS domain-containing protein